MPVTVKQLKRVFRYGATEYPDPDPTQPAERVLSVLSVANPAINNAVLEGPSVEGDKQVYAIKAQVGTKG